MGVFHSPFNQYTLRTLLICHESHMSEKLITIRIYFGGLLRSLLAKLCLKRLDEPKLLFFENLLSVNRLDEALWAHLKFKSDQSLKQKEVANEN